MRRDALAIRGNTAINSIHNMFAVQYIVILLTEEKCVQPIYAGAHTMIIAYFLLRNNFSIHFSFD